MPSSVTVAFSVDEIADFTPEWIRQWCALPGNDGGWYTPMRLSATHPLVADAWACHVCRDHFVPADIAFIYPLATARKWLAHHRECAADLYIPRDRPEERALLRPANYADLPGQEQWKIDKRLGILDWKGR